MRIRSIATIATAAMALTLAACGSPPSANPTSGSTGSAASGLAENPKLAEYFALSGDERRKALIDAAQEEGGQLDLYTSMTSNMANAVVKAFSSAFDIDVNLYRADSESVLQRIIQEAKAGYAGSDVVETNGPELYALNTEGLLANYSSEWRDEVPDVGRFDGWTASRFNLFTISWNTDKVSADEAPKTWEDLADPRWDGQLAMEVADSDWYMTLSKYWLDEGKSQEEIDKLFGDMADGAQVVKGHTVMGELLSAGQYEVAASNYSYLVKQAMDKGGPLEYRPMAEPVISRPNGGGIVKNAKHPAAATLFFDWYLGEEGQRLLADLGITPSNPPADVPDELEGKKVVSVDLKELMENSSKWNQLYADLVAKGTKK